LFRGFFPRRADNPNTVRPESLLRHWIGYARADPGTGVNLAMLGLTVIAIIIALLAWLRPLG
jgi:hypothetical protein